MNDLQVFNYEGASVRVIDRDGEPWFVGKDVAEVLGYANTKDALSVHVDEDDKCVIQRSEITTFEIPNRGMIVINESGLYSLILSSHLPGARQFKRWVTSEVLPSIRKHGIYATIPITFRDARIGSLCGSIPTKVSQLRVPSTEKAFRKWCRMPSPGLST